MDKTKIKLLINSLFVSILVPYVSNINYLVIVLLLFILYLITMGINYFSNKPIEKPCMIKMLSCLGMYVLVSEIAVITKPFGNIITSILIFIIILAIYSMSRKENK